VFFSLSSWTVALIIVALVGGITAVGVVLGRYLRKHSDALREPFGVLQGALLGVVGLILAFGLSLAVGRYEDRRAAVVAEANAIGTTYLRAQLLAEPARTRSLALLRDYTDLAILITREVPGSASLKATAAAQGRLQQNLWRLAGRSMNSYPENSAQRLYVDSLNAMIDQQTVRLSGLSNRVPNEVLWLEMLAPAVALGALSLYLSLLGKGHVTVLVAAILVSALVVIIFDLDRPTRGLITVPANALVAQRASMSLPPAAVAPRPG